jgi:hypothetical protein
MYHSRQSKNASGPGLPGPEAARLMKPYLYLAASLVLFFAATGGAAARGVYQEPDEFLIETFAGATPEPKALWITPELKRDVAEILGHPPAAMRIRYWADGARTAWIVEEIGKEKPITTGVVVNDGAIERVKVLIFRETRGWEVRHDFFTAQFTGATLDEDRTLDRPIDGISGATMSVSAVTRLARVVLYLDRHVSASEHG